MLLICHDFFIFLGIFLKKKTEYQYLTPHCSQDTVILLLLYFDKASFLKIAFQQKTRKHKFKYSFALELDI